MPDQPTDAGKDREAAHALIAGLWPGKAARTQNVELATKVIAAARAEGAVDQRPRCCGPCETCRYRTLIIGAAACGLTLRVEGATYCETLGGGCRAWAPKEAR